MLTNNKLMVKYKKHLIEERRNTQVRSIMSCVKDLINRMGPHQLRKMETEELHKRLMKYRSYLITRRPKGLTHGKLKSSSVTTIIINIRSFLTWAKLSYPNEFIGLKMAKRMPRYVPLDEIKALKKRIESLPPLKNSVIHFLLLLGIRLSELINLRLDQVDTKTRLVTVMGKGSKERTVEMPLKLIPIIKKYLKRRMKLWKEHLIAKEDRQILFVKKWRYTTTRPYRRLYPMYVERIVSKLSVKSHLTPHGLRHTYATWSVYFGVPISQIKESLGHASVATTGIYSEATAQGRKLAVKTTEKWFK